MAMKVVTPTTPITFTKVAVAAAVMRAAHVLARCWMAQTNLVGDYQDFLKAALRLAWDMARGVTPRVPVWASDLTLPAEVKALVLHQEVPAPNRFEIAEGDNPFAAFLKAFGVNAKWGWPSGRLYAYMAAEIAAAKVVATCHHLGEEHTFWSF